MGPVTHRRKHLRNSKPPAQSNRRAIYLRVALAGL
ncbi:hypothetical protein C8D87_1011754 [Lentzea atacamensis]|uniref:Uncharacterized protein n=1 Tax=Lentzea atacamensis TaxID=531938 RepID=A0ABX9ENL8_9PSEU|nr:hypothetical protein C8D87_1011754 [Lentzea atacamensis]